MFREREPDDDDVNDAFDTVLERVRQVQRAYNVLQLWPLRLVVREMLPIVVPL